MPLLTRTIDLRPRYVPGGRPDFVWHADARQVAHAFHRQTFNRFRLDFPKHSVRISDRELDDFAEFEDDQFEREVAIKAQWIIGSCLADVEQRFNPESVLDSQKHIEHTKRHQRSARVS